MVELNDETAHDLQAAGMDGLHRLKKVAAQIVRFSGLFEAGLVWGFDPDEIIIHDLDRTMPAASIEDIDLRDELRRCFGQRLTASPLGDVAEFAVKRVITRELYQHGIIVTHIDKFQSRYGREAEVRP